jgi:hypothetical protein
MRRPSVRAGLGVAAADVGRRRRRNDEHRLPDLGPLPMPGYLLGQLGKGRVAVVHCWPHPTFAAFTALRPGDYLVNLLNWLANHSPQPAE